MSKILVNIDYAVAATIIKGLKGQAHKLLDWLTKLEELLDKAVLEDKNGKS